MARGMVGEEPVGRKKSHHSQKENNIPQLGTSHCEMRLLLAILAALTLPAAAAAAEPRTVKPDRAAIDRLLDAFIPAAVVQKDLQRGWELSAGAARTVSHADWMKGNTSVQKYPAKGTKFRGWTVNYSYPGDLGFDILLQPSTASLGAWSFRADAQKIHGQWEIKTW